MSLAPRTLACLFLGTAACAGEISPALDASGTYDLSTTIDLAGVDLAGADLAGMDLSTPHDLAATGGSGAALTPGTQTLTMTVGAATRSYILHVPAGGPMPLVIALHGNGDTNTNFVSSLMLSAKADAAPFVLIAPQGISSMPPLLGGQSVDWDAYTQSGNQDEAFLDALKAMYGGSSTIDQKRIFVWGYSQGGYMSMRWGMDRSATLSCAGVIAASSPTGDGLFSTAARKIAVDLQVGDQDPAVSAARDNKTALMSAGFPLQYTEIAGAGHVPFPGDPQTSLTYCLGQALP